MGDLVFSGRQRVNTEGGGSPMDTILTGGGEGGST